DYKARFYSPVLNRFIQPDTIVPNPVSPQDFNRFSYVINNPINLIDPSGHCYYNGTWIPNGQDGTCSWQSSSNSNDNNTNGGSGNNNDDEEEEEGGRGKALPSLDEESYSCPTDVGFVLFCTEFTTGFSQNFWKDSTQFASAIDLLGIGADIFGLGIGITGYLTSMGVLTPEFIALFFGASVSPEAVSKIGLITLAVGIYTGIGSYELSNVNSNIVESGMYENGGTISVSLFGSSSSESKGLLVFTIDSTNGRYQSGSITVIPTIYTFLWATNNAPSGSHWVP
ncbi:MAG: hypothetical protein JNJ43_17715, partial [Anaerolineales bacterium]|nr:hypothetical protein [Anaerolineales bacterium]